MKCFCRLFSYSKHDPSILFRPLPARAFAKAYFLKDIENIWVCRLEVCCKKLFNVSSRCDSIQKGVKPYAGFLSSWKPYSVVPAIDDLALLGRALLWAKFSSNWREDIVLLWHTTR